MDYEKELIKALEKAGEKATVYSSFTTSSCNTTEIKDPCGEDKVIRGNQKNGEGVA